MVRPSTRSGGPSVDPTGLHPAVLGHDMGMTATRASFMRVDWKGVKNMDPIVVPRDSSHLARDQYYGGDIPATAYPFRVTEKPEDCLDYTADTHAVSFPLKMYPYFKRSREYLRAKEMNKVNTIRKTIPQIDDLYKRLEGGDAEFQEQVENHLGKIFCCHLRKVREQSKRKARTKTMQIVKLAVTIPPNWDAYLQTIYVDLLSEVWEEIHPDDITIIHESDAAAHWVFWSDQRWQESTTRQILIADFGGHTLVFGALRREAGGDFAFFSTEKAWTKHGGSEFHSSLVKAKIESKMLQKGMQLEEVEKERIFEECMAQYRKEYRSTVDGTPFVLEGTVKGVKKGRKSPPRVPFKFTFGAREAKAMYNTAFAKPLSVLDDEFDFQADKSRDTVVMLSGGSFLNDEVLKRTIESIEGHRLAYLPWTEELGDTDKRSSMISSGAALAVTNSVTVPEFMAKAGFALDDCQDHELHTGLPVILGNCRSREVTLDLEPHHHGTKLILACTPLASSYDAEQVQRWDTYELFSLARPKKGFYRWSLAYESLRAEYGHTDWLLLTETEIHGSVVGQKVFRLPVYYDPGGCVCFVDLELLEKMNADNPSLPTATMEQSRNKKGKSYHQSWNIWQKDGAKDLWDNKFDENEPRTRLEGRKQARRKTKPGADAGPQKSSTEDGGYLATPTTSARFSPILDGLPRYDWPVTEDHEDSGTEQAVLQALDEDGLEEDFLEYAADDPPLHPTHNLLKRMGEKLTYQTQASPYQRNKGQQPAAFMQPDTNLNL